MHKGNVFPNMSMAYNRTMLELKYVVASSTRRVSCAYNRTMLELKFDNYGYVYGLMVL